jgi:hypothetical protein
MTISRSQYLVLLEPKVSNIWNEVFPQRAVEWTKCLNARTAKKATITDAKLSDFGPLALKGEGSDITYMDPSGSQTKTYSPVRFAGGYKITQEMIDHELYGQVDEWEGRLMKSAIDGQEVTAALVFNNAFGTTNADGFSATGFDGLQLCSTAHTRLDGGTAQSNRPATDADLGVSTLQAAIIAYHNWLDDQGRPAMYRPMKLLVSPEDMFTARELLGSEYKPGTANNDINALKEEGLTFMVSHYKTDTDAWFLLGDRTDLNFIWDVKPRQGMKEDFDAEVIKRKVVQGFAVGHGEWRGVYGSSGG